MKVLHLFSNAKWTGPAEPALNLCLALRRAGVEAEFACAPDSGESINKIVETARDRGLEPVLRFHLKKHKNPFYNFLDARTLRRYLASERFDLVHCHLDNDHRIAAAATRRVGIPVVRSSYHGEGFSVTRGHGALARQAAFVIEPSRLAQRNDVARLGVAESKTAVVPGAVDTERFDPTREVPDARRWLGIAPDAFVVGIVARMQRHRHYDDFFEAVRRLVDACPKAEVIVVGRGTYQESVGHEPVRNLGLEGKVHFPGYVDGENYVGMLKAFDVKVFLTPGSDGTCRAVREAMAMGKPVVAANRGMLSEVVEDGRTGVVFDGGAASLAEALTRMARERGWTRALGQAAREKARRDYSLESQARAVRAVYMNILGQAT